MIRIARVWAATFLLLTTGGVAWAQVPPPPGPAGPVPPPPPAAPPATATPEAPPAPAAAPPGAAEPVNPPAAPAAAGAADTAPEPDQGAASAPTAADPDAISEEEFEELERKQAARVLRLQDHLSLSGSTGLLRTQYAGSGPAGTFRFSILGSYMSTTEFLCPQCSDPDGGPGETADEVSRVGAHVHVSATPLAWLEAYLAVHSTATSNTRGDPELLQVLGDSTWGAKAFMPREANSPFSAGGGFELLMLNGTGGVGLEGASVALNALTTFDFTNYEKPEDRAPLRINVGLSYVFDNSGDLVAEDEEARNLRISRIERYGLNVNRLDRIVPALGIEGMWEAVRPYMEWSIDIPSNRQDYTCLQNDVFASDACLRDAPSFTGTPSRFTIGSRFYALLDGLGFHVALDLGTGGMKPPFWEEVQPESPWNLYFGMAYTADTQPRIERVKVAAPVPEPVETKPETHYLIEGIVVEKGSEGVGVPNAIVRYQGNPLTGMVTNEQGAFRTVYLEPGTYTLNISADGYKDGSCSITIDPAAGAPGELQADAAPGADGPAMGADAAGSVDMSGGAMMAEASADSVDGTDDIRAVQARCELEAQPKLGTLEISVVNGEDDSPLGAASVVVSKDGRSITLNTDEEGQIVVSDVPAGPVSLKVSVDGFYPTMRRAEVEPEARTASAIRVFPQGKANFQITKDAIKQRKGGGIQFEAGTSKLTAESEGLMDELAALLADKADLIIEVQSHTDDSLPFQEALTLTTERAKLVRERLVANGIEPGRVSAKGAGAASPQVPNTSDANKARNNRVDIVVRGGGG